MLFCACPKLLWIFASTLTHSPATSQKTSHAMRAKKSALFMSIMLEVLKALAKKRASKTEDALLSCLEGLAWFVTSRTDWKMA